MDILENEDFTPLTIENIIKNNLEESINIEFKSSGALSKQESVKKEISKDVSAFANSDGGIIIYGIEENKHVASKLSFIDGNIFTKEWIENIIISTIQPKIDNFKIIPIRFEDDIKKSVYVLKIPKSNNSPHMNGDKKYYRRYNFQSVPMEEYEVKNLYNKADIYDLDIENITTKHKVDENTISFDLQVLLINDGNNICSEYKVALDFENVPPLQITWNNNNDIQLTQKNKNNFKISNNKSLPIFPNEIFNALNFTVVIEKVNYNEFIEKAKIKILIFMKTGISELDIDANKMFKI